MPRALQRREPSRSRSRCPCKSTPRHCPPDASARRYSTTTLAASGGAPPYVWTRASGSLPNGVALSAAGVVSGTPTAASSFTFTARVDDSTGRSQTRSLTIVVTQLVITTSALPDARQGQPYTGPALAATNAIGTLTWSLNSGAMPAGLSLSSGGVVSGTPTGAGTFTLDVRATDTDGAFATRGVTLAVIPPLAITTSSVPNGTVGAAYPPTTLAASGGSGTRTWSIASGALPGGLSLSTAGVLSGTRRLPDRSTSRCGRPTPPAAHEGADDRDSQHLDLDRDRSAGPRGSSRSYVENLQATGGVPPLRWALEAGTLPPGLTLFPSGRLSGVPTTAGMFTFTARVTDNAGATASRALSLRIEPRLRHPTDGVGAGRSRCAVSL